MLSPLTIVLIKIFAKGFYRVHSGLFLFLFVAILSYCFFIEVLNQTHLSHDQVILNNLIFVLTLLTSPVLGSLVFIAWLVLTIKSWSYVTAQLLTSGNQFLLYSSTSDSRINQLKSWFIVQSTISLPIAGYAVFSLVIGIIFNHYLVPIIILSYVFLLSAVSALIYFRYANAPIITGSKSLLSTIIGNWRKPFYSLFIYHVFDNLKITLVVTKILSWMVIVSGLYLLEDAQSDLQVVGLITLGIVTAHTILVYQSFQFETTQLNFLRSLPYSKTKIYSNWALTYLLLTLPESAWLLLAHAPEIGIALLLFSLGTAMLFRSILYWVTLDMKKFMYWVFFLFNMFFLMILLKAIWVLIPVNLVVSVILFDQYYFRQKDFIKT